MSGLGHAKSFEDLVVYKKARAVADTVFELTKSFPREETYSLTDQVRRSSRSIGAQIAEAWGKRRYERHFVSKLTDADAEQLETQHWISVATRCGYLPAARAQPLVSELREIGKMLHSMIRQADRFCGDQDFLVREDTTEAYESHRSLMTDH
jgi:four helix bundle protein